jgi:hypothetical protein
LWIEKTKNIAHELMKNGQEKSFKGRKKVHTTEASEDVSLNAGNSPSKNSDDSE